MRYLLDTNVLSEAARPEPAQGVVAFLQTTTPLDLAISVLTVGEIRQGIVQLASGRRRRELQKWLSVDLLRQFSGRVLPVDEAVALAWGRLAAEGRAAGRRLPVIDGLLLATAQVHALTFVTRNVGDCGGRDVEVLDPWAGEGDG
ncbi:MAG: type II toxin-antitoxin system VapC family toxin [Gemmatimonadota bacterium]